MSEQRPTERAFLAGIGLVNGTVAGTIGTAIGAAVAAHFDFTTRETYMAAVLTGLSLFVIGAVIRGRHEFMGKIKSFLITKEPQVHNGVNRQFRLNSSDNRDIDGVQVWLTSLRPEVEGFLPSVLLRPQDVEGKQSTEFKFKLSHVVPKAIGVFGVVPNEPQHFRLYTLADDTARLIPALQPNKRYRGEIQVLGDDATPLNAIIRFGVNKKWEPLISIRPTKP